MSRTVVQVMEAEETQKALKLFQRKAQENAQVLQKEVERTTTEGLRYAEEEAGGGRDMGDSEPTDGSGAAWQARDLERQHSRQHADEEMCHSCARRLVSAEASKAFDNSPVDEKTKQEIRRRAEEAARVADAAAKELGKAAKAGKPSCSLCTSLLGLWGSLERADLSDVLLSGDEFIKSKETQQALAEATQKGSYAFGFISKSISSTITPKVSAAVAGFSLLVLLVARAPAPCFVPCAMHSWV